MLSLQFIFTCKLGLITCIGMSKHGDLNAKTLNLIKTNQNTSISKTLKIRYTFMVALNILKWIKITLYLQKSLRLLLSSNEKFSWNDLKFSLILSYRYLNISTFSVLLIIWNSYQYQYITLEKGRVKISFVDDMSWVINKRSFLCMFSRR